MKRNDYDINTDISIEISTVSGLLQKATPFGQLDLRTLSVGKRGFHLISSLSDTTTVTMISRHFYPVIILLLFITSISFANKERIRFNQLGFYPYGPKTAIVVAPETWYFSIRSPDLTTTFFTGELSAQSTWAASGETVKTADFSQFTEEGTYVVYVTGIGASDPFTISPSSLEQAATGLIRAFYYQRASTALLKQHAGRWSRPAGHSDNSVVIHASAASDPSRPGARREGETYSSPKGWYDAGDYGKYVVNAGISVYQLLLLYEQFPGFFDKLSLNIPESDDAVPDLLDEIKWEMDWLLTTQDPSDGGVYHKVTSKTFCGEIMPADDRDARYFIGKGSAATFDFIAVCAAAYRIYKKFLPAFADRCLEAAQYAWEWGSEHPDSLFKNPSDVVTGEYRDTKTTDEHQWAAFELFIATGDSAYYRAGKNISANYDVPSWPNVGMCGCYSMALINNDSLYKNKILVLADALMRRIAKSPYRVSIASEFYWGSNGVVANQGMTMLIAYLLTKKVDYLEGAIHACDYLFGRNAAGYSFVTGFGTRSAMRPHHRPSIADNISAPIPGFLVGGPNAQSRSGESCTRPYPKESAKAWIDQSCSFTTNEVAINWNAPAAFLAGGINAVFNSPGFDVQELHNKYGADTQPPQPVLIAITDVRADRAKLIWKTPEPAVVTIVYHDGTPAGPKKIHCPQADSGSTLLSGLLPETVHHVTCVAVDNRGNTAACSDSFRTETSPLYAGSVYNHDRGTYTAGSDLPVSFTHPASFSARLIFSAAASPLRDTIAFRETDGTYAATIPSSAVTAAGVRYSFALFNGTDTLSTPTWSIAPDSLSMSIASLCAPFTYSLVSLPGIFSPRSSLTLFAEALGDTADWRFIGYGHESGPGSYRVFATLQSGQGGWLYNKNNGGFTFSARGLPPDTLFPVVLRSGWNCIGNPFPFPIYWDNSMIGYGDALLQITDTVASRFARRQFFSYIDTLSDKINNGTYRSNRELISHVFNDSAVFVPWKAYWVYAQEDSVTLLLNPAPYRQSSALQKKQVATPRSWFCALQVRCGSLADGPIALGASELADDGYDPYDSPKPPPIASGFNAGFNHPEWNTATPVYAADITGISETGRDRWVLTIHSSQHLPVTITWQQTGSLCGSLVYADEKAGRIVSMDRSGSYTFTPDPDESAREIAFIRSPKRPDAASEPQTWSLSRLPGAVRRFTYAVPTVRNGRCHVSIDIFDIRGRRVRSLVDEQQNPGTYTIDWNGTTDRRKRAADGWYIVRLKGGPYSKSIGLHFVR